MTTMIDERPFFVGGAMHGRLVPQALTGAPFIRTGLGGGGEDIYMRTFFYRLNCLRLLVFYAKVGMDVDDVTTLVYRAVRQGRL